MDVLASFGRRIREKRTVLGLSQEAFADKCNLDRTYISGIERGKRNVSLRNIGVIAKTLGISIAELMEGVEKEQTVAVPKLYKGLGKIANRYEALFVALWRHAKVDAQDPGRVEFAKEDFVFHGKKMQEYGLVASPLDIKNIPDIIYTYRARANLPAEILAHGNFAVIGRGKGLYAFVSIPIPNRFVLPGSMKVVPLANQIPQWVRPYMQNDEQGMLTMLQVNNLVAVHLGLQSAFRLQSHLRCGVPSYGQVEVDKLYIGKGLAGERRRHRRGSKRPWRGRLSERVPTVRHGNGLAKYFSAASTAIARCKAGRVESYLPL